MNNLELINRDRTNEQFKAIDSIRSELARYGIALAVACTGYGKGHLIKLIAERLTGTMLVIVPRVNLVQDIAERIEGAGHDVNIFCASLGKKETGKITVGTIQSLIKGEISADLIIFDEVHTYKDETIEQCSARFKIGLTATPYTTNGYIYGEGKFWNAPCYEFTIADAIERGYLCDYFFNGSKYSYDIKLSNKKSDYTEKEISEIISKSKIENIVEEIIEIADNDHRKKTVIVTASIDHAEKVSSFIKEKHYVIHSKSKTAIEDTNSFKYDDTRFAVAVMMLSEGFDCRPIDMIAILRPSRSTRLVQQIYGRGLRSCEGKIDCRILDYGLVRYSCGTPHNPILNFEPTASKKEKRELIKTCQECYFIYENLPSCPRCGHVNKIEIDRSKNLESTILVDNMKEIELDGSNFWRLGKTVKGAKFCAYQKDDLDFYFFRKGDYFKAIKRKPMLVKYVLKKGKIQILSIVVKE